MFPNNPNGPLSEEGATPDNLNPGSQNFAAPKMQMIHEDVNQNEVTIEVEQQNQKPYSAAHATRKKVR